LAEEVVFRCVIYNRMKKHMPVIAAMILSALLFGIYHGNAVQALYGFCMGMLIVYTYERFGYFFYAFLFHAAANIAVYTITGNQRLYEMIIKPYVGIVLVCIAIVLLMFMKRRSVYNHNQ
ncbi:MAG: CPBP family intramembrane metalloprotease, partial [Lachnospiraceae bacterium]|nr:CPBP family intramembrane metalloprotease [Lachnospiraceae bacterium]